MTSVVDLVESFEDLVDEHLEYQLEDHVDDHFDDHVGDHVDVLVDDHVKDLAKIFLLKICEVFYFFYTKIL